MDVRLDEVVLRALQKEPELRYQRAGDVKTDLEGITSVTGTGGATSTHPSPQISGGVQPTATTLKRAWEEWWAERDKALTKIIKVFLLAVFVLGMGGFFGGGMSWSEDGRFKHQLGIPPCWFTFEENRGFEITPLSPSWIMLAVGMLAIYVYDRTQAGSHHRIS